MGKEKDRESKPNNKKLLDKINSLVGQVPSNGQAKIDAAPEDLSIPRQLTPQFSQHARRSSPVSKMFVEMTDIFKDIEIEVPQGKWIICKVNCAAILGLGDMMHMIRLAKVLDPLYTGRIRYFAITDGAPVFDHMVKEHQVNIEIIVPGQDITIAPESIILTLGISMSSSSDLAGRFYYLQEMQTSTEKPILNISERVDKDHFGLIPEAQGIWVDDIPLVENRGETLFKASQKLKDFLGTTNFQDAHQANHWLEKTWIAQSYYYSEPCFTLTLLAQLNYLKEKSPDVTRVIFKFSGRDKEGLKWKNNLDSKIIETMNNNNVRSISIDGEHIHINERNTLDVYLKNEIIPLADYSVLLSLLNMAFPGGDNTYSEAFSNPNLCMPPFPELSYYKIECLDFFFKDFREFNFIHNRCLAMNMTSSWSVEKIIDDAVMLSDAWLQLENPSQHWREASKSFRKHDITGRVHAIIREQIFFSLFPEGATKKTSLIFNQNNCNPSEEYRSYVHEKLSAAQLKSNKNNKPK